MRRTVVALAAACALVTTVSTTDVASAATRPVKFGKFVADYAGTKVADLPITNTKLNGEYIQVTNTTSKAIVLTGYTVRDNGNKHTFRFPAKFTLGAKRTVTVHTGPGRNTSSDLYWGMTKSYVWNNSGDTARLYNAKGALVHQCTYVKVASGTKYC